MKGPEKLKHIQAWLTFAKENLLLAQSGLREDFSPYHTICFLCQGSAEKYLKAFLICNEWKLKKTHDLSELLNYCLSYDNSFDQLFTECELLNEYITEGRYPGDLLFESIGEKDAEEAFNAAKKIEQHILRNIKLPNDDNNFFTS